MIQKILIFAFAIALPFKIFAYSLTCEVNQSLDNKSSLLNIQIELSTSPHGSVEFFTADKFEGITGFIALLEKDTKIFAVINLYSAKLQVGSSSQVEIINNNQYIHHQMILPSSGNYLSAVIVECKFLK